MNCKLLILCFLLIIYIYIILKKHNNTLNPIKEHLNFTDDYMKKSYETTGIKLNTNEMSLEKCNNTTKNCKKLHYLYNSNPLSAREICNHKAITNQTLTGHDIPVSGFFLLRHQNKNTPLTTLEIELKRKPLKYPLVIKPIDGTHGTNVIIGIKNKTELIDELNKLFKQTDAIIIEEQLTGKDYRVLVINDGVVDIVEREVITITGNGTSTIQELIQKRNEKQKINGAYPTHNLDWKLIAEQTGGLDGTGILKQNQTIIISNVRNFHNGANINRLDLSTIHPDNIALFKAVNKAIGLNVGGIDYMSSDITKSYKDTDGRIIEVNSAPGLDLHVNPKDNLSQHMGERVVLQLFQ